MIGLNDARRIAERYLIGLSAEAGTKLELLNGETLEREFGWVFYYGPQDNAMTVAGNAPFIVDRKDGSIHVTGTAHPTQVYVENYALTGTVSPPGIPEHTVVLEGWRPGKPPFGKVSLTKAIRAATDKGLAESKRCTDQVLSGEDVALMFSTAQEAEKFVAAVQRLGVVTRRQR